MSGAGKYGQTPTNPGWGGRRRWFQFTRLRPAPITTERQRPKHESLSDKRRGLPGRLSSGCNATASVDRAAAAHPDPVVSRAIRMAQLNHRITPAQPPNQVLRWFRRSSGPQGCIETTEPLMAMPRGSTPRPSGVTMSFLAPLGARLSRPFVLAYVQLSDRVGVALPGSFARGAHCLANHTPRLLRLSGSDDRRCQLTFGHRTSPRRQSHCHDRR